MKSYGRHTAPHTKTTTQLSTPRLVSPRPSATFQVSSSHSTPLPADYPALPSPRNPARPVASRADYPRPHTSALADLPPRTHPRTPHYLPTSPAITGRPPPRPADFPALASPPRHPPTPDRLPVSSRHASLPVHSLRSDIATRLVPAPPCPADFPFQTLPRPTTSRFSSHQSSPLLADLPHRFAPLPTSPCRLPEPRPVAPHRLPMQRIAPHPGRLPKQARPRTTRTKPDRQAAPRPPDSIPNDNPRPSEPTLHPPTSPARPVPSGPRRPQPTTRT